jgi:hypothetical protein
MVMTNKWTLNVKHDDESGDTFIELPDDLMIEAGWNLGDDIEWIDNKDGSWTMKKKENKQWVLVETVQMFRHRYMCEVPKGKAEWALDTVTMEEAKEFSQQHLGETIVSHRTLTMEEALELCDQDNDYARKWNDDHKIKTFFTKDGEKVDNE